MVQGLRNELTESQHKASSLVQMLRAHEQKHRCEALYATGRIMDAAASLLELMNTVSEEARTNELIMNWLTGEFLRNILREYSIHSPRVYASLRINSGKHW